MACNSISLVSHIRTGCMVSPPGAFRFLRVPLMTTGVQSRSDLNRLCASAASLPSSSYEETNWIVNSWRGLRRVANDSFLFISRRFMTIPRAMTSLPMLERRISGWRAIASSHSVGSTGTHQEMNICVRRSLITCFFEVMQSPLQFLIRYEAILTHSGVGKTACWGCWTSSCTPRDPVMACPDEPRYLDMRAPYACTSAYHILGCMK